MIDYRHLRRKFPAPKNASGSAARKAKIKAIAREYERKRAELGLGDGPPRRRFPYYMAVAIGMMLVAALVCSAIFERGGIGLGQDLTAKGRLCVHNLAVALGRYRYHVGRYPSTEGGLALLALKRSGIRGWNGPYVREIHRDPWGHDYVYRYNGETADPTLYSLGPDGVAATPDDIVADRADFDAAFRDTSWTKGWMPQHLRGYVLAQDERHRRRLEAEVESVLHPEIPVEGRRILNDGWRFAQVWKSARPAAGGESPPADPGPDSPELEWQPVELPHDWAIAGPFDAGAEDGATARLPWRGVGYYRRELTVSPKAKGRFVALRFAGAMARPEVRLNGERVGGWDYGYLGFEVDLSEKLRFDRPNDLVVRVDTSGCVSRWYPGAGICRDVELAIEDPVDRMLYNSLSIVALSITPEKARMRAVYARPDGTVTNDFEVAEPICWSPERPFLYNIEICGEYCAYGIRTAEFRSDGFYLNGNRMQLKGVNLHSDLGLLGMAFNRQAALRQLSAMKDLGANAIRFAHNPPDPQMLELCDRMGFVVWDECFDKWDETAGILPGEDRDAFVKRNLAAFVRRDRNHPCVVCWSIGNEISHADGGDAASSMRERCRGYREAVLAEDPTRPVGIGCCHPENIAAGDFDDLDFTGWNYGAQYRLMRERLPGMPVVYSESASAFSSWGAFRQPVSGSPIEYGPEAEASIDAYDRTSAKWGDIPDVEFARMARDRYCAGEFVWTGIDYLGEPTPFARRCRSSFFGICDLTVLPKDRYWLYRSLWNTREKTVHLLPHWNWEGREGQPVRVVCYTSGDEAELFLNGESRGRVRKVPCGEPVADKADPAYYGVCGAYRLEWDCPYEPGEIKVIAYRDGAYLGEAWRKTAMKPRELRASADRDALAGGELAFVTIEARDDYGVAAPLCDARVELSVEGPGEIVAAGNGRADGMESFAGARSVRLDCGRAVVVVRRLRAAPTGNPFALTVRAAGMREARVVLPRRRED